MVSMTSPKSKEAEVLGAEQRRRWALRLRKRSKVAKARQGAFSPFCCALGRRRENPAAVCPDRRGEPLE
jgi:hypothetical protein